ncbi:isoprenylcysteine carboxyl methyltransferase [Roseibium aquae]|uniref:Isoprenylcysteine carboxyl methyltransferase n=1 Tax=Roseibium aquae TaxID=1323746 RepID=A0A916TQA1_9HYPH|nr:isoprenylcysteine carboxylmethyltransferase family protein [Roseibium aquae]GGB61136.1 isoprenylcysteine carboxyl methyltransferase [Roseibium aquae]
MKLVVPPPVVGLTGAAGIWGMVTLAPGLAIDFPGKTALGLGFAVAGLLLEGWGVGRFIRRKTTVNPLRPQKASSLVIEGPYRFTRNPMYLGLALLLTAWSLHLGAVLPGALVIAAVLWYLTEFQIKPEEAALEILFGAQYHAYKSRVRRWI